MTETQITYSIVIPVFNSQKSLKELVSEIKSVFLKVNNTFEIIFIDDSSTDNSWNILQEIKKNNTDIPIILIQLTQNFGQHKATLCGIDFSRGKYIITMDDDLQILPEEIIKLIAKQEENPDIDLIYGYYKNKKHSSLRNAGSKLFTKSTKLFREAKKSGSSFRLFKSTLRKQLEFARYRDFIYLDELLLWITGKIDFVCVKHHKRKYNKSGYSFRKLFSIGSHLILFSSSKPIQLMIIVGFLLSFISFGTGIFFIYRKMFHNVPMGYTSIIVAILFSTSILLISLGIIAGYLNAIFIQINKKPTYLTKTIIK